MSKLTQTFTEAQIKQITDYLLIERTALCTADLGFVFGNKHYNAYTAPLAADLYHQGFFPKILVTGAPRMDCGRKEAHYLRDTLITFGVPGKDIWVEDQSTNTQENIEFAKDIIDRKAGLENVKSIIGMGQVYAGRRYMMTVKKRWPSVLNMQFNVNAFGGSVQDWYKNAGFRTLVETEWNKLPDYLQKGFIEEIDVDQINEEVFDLFYKNKNVRVYVPAAYDM